MYWSTLWPGQLPALAGLRALRHLDLQLVRVREVVRVDAEAAGGDLLDRRAARVAVLVRHVARRVLPALARVRAAADAVHRDREVLVRLARERAERHRAGREALDDLLRWLDLVQRDAAVLGAAEAEQAAQRRAPRRVVVDDLRVLPVRLVAAGAHRVLEQRDRVGVPGVELALPAPGVEAGDRQQPVRASWVGARVPVERLAREHVEPDPADARRGAGEVAVDELLRQSDRLEDLRSAVGGDRRDPHLRDRLQQALGDPLRRPALRVVLRHPRRQPAELDQLRERLEHQVRVDRGGAVADQHGDALHAARLARLDDQAGLEARPLADEVMVDGGDGEQGRDRRALRPDRTVGEDEDVRAGGERRVGLGADARDGVLERIGPVGDRPRRVDRVAVEDVGVDLAQPFELLVEQDRVRDHELARVLGRLVEQIPLGADARLHAHHDRLADRVDRRVRHLREELLEVGVEQRLPVGENGERQVVPHRADRLLGVPRERREDHLHVVLRVAEGELALAQRLGGAGEVRPRRQILEPNDLVSIPLGVRLPRGDRPLHLLVRDDPAVLDVDQEQLPRLQPSLPQHVLRRLVEHARLRREHDPAVLGLEPPARTQAVAVERRADHATVRERDRRRAVPGFHQALVVGVEPCELLGDVLATLVGLGDHHHDRVRERAAREHEQLEHVVERRPSRSRRGGRPAGSWRGRRRRAPKPAATRARSSS